MSVPEEVPFWLCCTASPQCRSTGSPTACLIAAVLAPHSSGTELRQAWAQSVPETSLPVPANPWEDQCMWQCFWSCPSQKGMHGFVSSKQSAATIHQSDKVTSQGCQPWVSSQIIPSHTGACEKKRKEMKRKEKKRKEKKRKEKKRKEKKRLHLLASI